VSCGDPGSHTAARGSGCGRMIRSCGLPKPRGRA
jgi:hypothetical protein